VFEKLLDKLNELFQLNQPELDFGIYRIMHAKAGEISTFLEHDLLPQVQQALSAFGILGRLVGTASATSSPEEHRAHRGGKHSLHFNRGY